MGKQITKTLCEECSGGREIITSSVTLCHLTSVKSLTSALLRKGHTLLTKEEAIKTITAKQVSSEHTAPQA